MTKAEWARTGVGVGFLAGVLSLLIVLRVAGEIDWSWWAVTAPLWVTACYFAGVVIGGAILDVWRARRRQR